MKIEDSVNFIQEDCKNVSCSKWWAISLRDWLICQNVSLVEEPLPQQSKGSAMSHNALDFIDFWRSHEACPLEKLRIAEVEKKFILFIQ